MFRLVDNILNNVTVYRLALYFLVTLVVVATIFAAVGILPYNPFAIIFSASLFILVCLGANKIFSVFLKAPTNIESVYITALILALIMPPVSPEDWTGIAILLAVGAFAMASKYILAIRKKHIFNPAAVAAFITVLLFNRAASWWVGVLPIFPFVLAGGVLLVRKLRRADMVWGFAAAWFLTTMIFERGNPDAFFPVIKTLILHSPILFFTFVMFTEPSTTPPRRAGRLYYGALVGLLLGISNYMSSVYSTPEVVLLVGNIFSYAVSPKGRLVLTLEQKLESAKNTFDFIFKSNRRFTFLPGQYLEWTIPSLRADNRGNRRYFTIASSPTEPNVRIGVKFPEKSSSFKKELLALELSAKVVASQRAGDFVLPEDSGRKLGFIAGGIGITPFRSMVKYLRDIGEKRDIVILYSTRTPAEIAYRNIFSEAENIGVKTIYTVTDEIPQSWGGRRGIVDAEMVRSAVPDYKERVFYVSGPNAMVVSISKILRRLGVPRARIKKDFFPGYI